MLEEAVISTGFSLRLLGLLLLEDDFKCPEHLGPEHVGERGLLELLRTLPRNNLFFLGFSNALGELRGLQSYSAHWIVDAINIGEGSIFYEI